MKKLVCLFVLMTGCATPPMPPAVRETPETLSSWGLKEVSPGLWVRADKEEKD